MPRKPIDFSRGLIYQIEKEGIVYYVGSTTNFTKRKSGHKTACNNENDKSYHYPIYTFMRDNGGWDAFIMILIEYYKCNDKNELEAREQHFINEFKTHLLNSKYASRTREQYRIDNKTEISIRGANYLRNNREEINIRRAKFRRDNKDKISIRGAKYYEDNKEEIAIKASKFREDNKEKIKIQQAKKYQNAKAQKLLNYPTPSIV